MSIHRIDRKGKKSGGYTLISNDVINDPRLTFLAVGLLLWMLSLPETWHFSLEGIYAWAVKYGHKAGETAIKNAIHSLESAGYLYRSPEKVRGADGRWLAENWEVFERPQDNPHYYSVCPEADNPPMETLSPVIPAEAHPEVKRDISYDEILSARPESAGLLDIIVHEIATVELSDDVCVRIGKDKIRREKAVSHYYALTAVWPPCAASSTPPLTTTSLRSRLSASR